MVSILAWAKDQNNVERLTIGSMAKLSLATNASRDKELLDMLKASMNGESKDTRVVLQEVIDAAETFEFARVRKDAMAAIDQLKMKGPASARNMHGGARRARRRWRSAASSPAPWAMFEVGIPCVVGGAVSGAALKYMTPQKTRSSRCLSPGSMVPHAPTELDGWIPATSAGMTTLN